MTIRIINILLFDLVWTWTVPWFDLSYGEAQDCATDLRFRQDCLDWCQGPWRNLPGIPSYLPCASRIQKGWINLSQPSSFILLITPLIIVLTISIILTQTPKNTISTHYITYTGARNTQHFIPSLYDSTLFPLHVQIVIPLISSAFLIVNIVFFLNSPLPPYSLTSIAFQNCKQ